MLHFILITFKQCPNSFTDLCLNSQTIESIYSPVHSTGLLAQSVECPLLGKVDYGFDPGPRHTKVVKNGTSCSSLGTQSNGIELGLADPVSG